MGFLKTNFINQNLIFFEKHSISINLRFAFEIKSFKFNDQNSSKNPFREQLNEYMRDLKMIIK
jgi:hypothetical protein